jgi:hypothetical protein
VACGEVVQASHTMVHVEIMGAIWMHLGTREVGATAVAARASLDLINTTDRVDCSVEGRRVIRTSYH